MDVIPPQRINAPKIRFHRTRFSPIQILLHLGISRQRAEKALAATGNQSAQTAMNWLVSHVNDINLDENEMREYTLVAVPFGSVYDHLVGFWEDSNDLTGWNDVHNALPHIMLIPFFQAPPECEPDMSKCLSDLAEKFTVSIKRLELELMFDDAHWYYKVRPQDARFLRNMACVYIKEVGPLVVNEVGPSQATLLLSCFPWFQMDSQLLPRNVISSEAVRTELDNLHLTIAKNFQPNEIDPLLGLTNRLDLSDAREWEMRLYSRDTRLSGKQIFRAKQKYRVRAPDEMDINVGDYICVPENNVNASEDGWVDGLNVSSGAVGFFPLNHVIRVAESDNWSLHRSLVIYSPNGERGRDERAMIEPQITAMSPLLPESRTSSDESSRATIEALKKLVIWNPKVGELVAEPNDNQKLFIMRHGERLDFTFPKWANHCFTGDGVYHRLDLNMPRILPRRAADICVYPWRFDTPITNIGVQQARLTGEMLRDQHIEIEYVFCSPSYRCLQTARAVLEGMASNDQVKIRVEPALFEWCAWYSTEVPKFLTLDELTIAGFNIDTNYVPIISVENLHKRYKTESIYDFYHRNHLVSDYVDKKIQNNVLIVAHAANLETNSRILLGGKPHRIEKIREITTHIPYCSLLTLEKVRSNRWSVAGSTVYPITHSRNFHFDWRVFD